jgi:excisionase family DNA binding protein
MAINKPTPEIDERIKQARLHVQKNAEKKETPQVIQTDSPPVAITQAIGPPTLEVPQLIDMDTAKGWMSVSRVTVYGLVKSGTLPFVRIGGPTGPLRFRAQDVLDYINNQTKTEWDGIQRGVNPPPRKKGKRK